jgi:DNA-binding XRE family transcriptional regulator
MRLRDRNDLTKLMQLKALDSDRALAAEAELHHSTVHRIHTDPDYLTHLDTATKIADALGVEVERLFAPAGQNGTSQPPDSE